MTARQAILERLRNEAPALREEYRLESLAVSGSIARGNDREGSDVGRGREGSRPRIVTVKPTE